MVKEQKIYFHQLLKFDSADKRLREPIKERMFEGVKKDVKKFRYLLREKYVCNSLLVLCYLSFD